VKPGEEWELFQTFTDIGSAEVVCDLVHRARWIVAQPPPTDAELDFLATGKLPGADSPER